MLKTKYIAFALPLLLLLLMPMGVAAHDPVDGHEIHEDTTLTADHLGVLAIKADTVTLDCAGHEVIGVGNANIGILLEGRTGVTVKNCRVRNFRIGFHLSLSSGNILEGNAAIDNNEIGFF